MTIRVRAFAIHRELLGRDVVDLELPDDSGATPRSIFESLFREKPQSASLLRVTKFAVNKEYVGGDEPLASGDELAFIAPIAGGCS